jgi:hypothetical protein
MRGIRNKRPRNGHIPGGALYHSFEIVSLALQAIKRPSCKRSSSEKSFTSLHFDLRMRFGFASQTHRTSSPHRRSW